MIIKLKDDLDLKIVYALERISEIIRNLRINRGKLLGLSPIQIQILKQLYNNKLKELTLTTLSEYFQISKPSLSESISNLEKKGYIQKIQSNIDKRNDIITLTNEGNKIYRKLQNHLMPLYKALKNMYPGNKEKTFSTLLEIIFYLYNSGVIKIQNMCYACKFFVSPVNSELPFCTLLEKHLEPQEIRLDCEDFVSRKDINDNKSHF